MLMFKSFAWRNFWLIPNESIEYYLYDQNIDLKALFYKKSSSFLPFEELYPVDLMLGKLSL